jgi:hypothetical protein
MEKNVILETWIRSSSGMQRVHISEQHTHSAYTVLKGVHLTGTARSTDSLSPSSTLTEEHLTAGRRRGFGSGLSGSSKHFFVPDRPVMEFLALREQFSASLDVSLSNLSEPSAHKDAAMANGVPSAEGLKDHVTTASQGNLHDGK